MPLRAAILSFILFLSPAAALADYGDFMYGVGASADPFYGAVSLVPLNLHFGVSDYFALRAHAGVGSTLENMGIDTLSFESQASALLLFDVLSWVPQVELGVGVNGGPSLSPRPIGTLGFSVRRYFSMSKSLELGFTWARTFSQSSLNEYRLSIVGWVE